jgi:hypothetical protein
MEGGGAQFIHTESSKSISFATKRRTNSSRLSLTHLLYIIERFDQFDKVFVKVVELVKVVYIYIRNCPNAQITCKVSM